MPDDGCSEGCFADDQSIEYWQAKVRDLQDELDKLRTIMEIQNSELEYLRNPPVTTGTSTSGFEFDPALKDQGHIKFYGTSEG